ncbi:MAG: hypothetical protein IKI31_01610 [Treponema sp.]|nr:hypothetical protein [Treponema sp.]
MLLLLSIILILWGVSGLFDDAQCKAERYNDRLREEKRKNNIIKAMKENKTKNKRITRTVAKDEHGRVIAQEIEEWYDDINYYNDDIDY